MQSAEIAFGLRVFRLGTRITLALAVSAAVYVLAAGEANRNWLLLLCGLNVAHALLVSRLPHRRILEQGRAPLLWGFWNATHVVGIATAALLAGPGSPFVGLFWVSVAFAAASLPGLFVVAITALNAVGVAVVTLVLTPGAGVVWALGLRWTALAGAAFVCWTLAADRRRQVLTLEHHNREIVRRLALVVEHRDNDTGGHVERIGSYTAILAEELGFGAPEREQIRLAATLHDVGKVGIPDAILLKPGRLTDEERTVMQRHAQIGEYMLTGSGIDVLDLAAEIAATHHEWFDGSGYPRGLAGDDIPLAGRIVAVADVFDAVTSHRVYKPAMDFDTARALIEQGAGTQFDPGVVAAFVRRIEDVHRVHAQSQAQAPAGSASGPALVVA